MLEIVVGFLGDVYTVCNPEVVSTGWYHASLVSYPDDWIVGAFAAVPASFPFQNHAYRIDLCFCSADDPLLVQSFGAPAVVLEDEEECADEREEEA